MALGPAMVGSAVRGLRSERWVDGRWRPPREVGPTLRGESSDGGTLSASSSRLHSRFGLSTTEIDTASAPAEHDPPPMLLMVPPRPASMPNATNRNTEDRAEAMQDLPRRADTYPLYVEEERDFLLT
mgnify:CR=1 FL=1